MKLDPLSLRLITAAVEESAIARAAARKNIAPSGTGRWLAELQHRLEVPLFARSNCGSGLCGQVRVVANISAVTQLLPSALQRFWAQHPHVHVCRQAHISSAVAQSVANHAADVGSPNEALSVAATSALSQRRTGAGRAAHACTGALLKHLFGPGRALRRSGHSPWPRHSKPMGACCCRRGSGAVPAHAGDQARLPALHGACRAGRGPDAALQRAGRASGVARLPVCHLPHDLERTP